MAKLFSDQDARRQLLADFREYARSLNEPNKHEKIRKILEDEQAKESSESDEDQGVLPSETTIKGWLHRSKTIGREYEPLIDSFLRRHWRKNIVMTMKDYDAVRGLYGFFGHDIARIREVGPRISGQWMMYRRWQEKGERYLVSPVDITHKVKEDIILVRDSVAIVFPDAEFQFRTEEWNGIALPQGRYLYLILRSSDPENGMIDNLKFLVLDDIAIANETTDRGSSLSHIMSGKAMIGVHHHKGANSFPTVLFRTNNACSPSQNPVDWEEIPASVRDALIRIES